jgi:hypothetical protein
VPKFTSQERQTIESTIAALSIKRIPEYEILQEVQRQLGGKTITKQTLYNAKRRIKKESSKWYTQLRESQYDYIFEFKERINEIMDSQRRHYEILDSKVPTTVKQASLAALHKLNVTLSNYYDIIPFLTATVQKTQTLQNQTQTETERNTGIRMDPTGNYTKMPIIENCQCRLNSGDMIRHNECRYCLHIWCPKAIGQEWCPNRQCSHGIKGNEFQPWDPNYSWIKCSCGMWFKTQEILDAHVSAYQHNA